jgi:uracil-DNA glycosylase
MNYSMFSSIINPTWIEIFEKMDLNIRQNTEKEYLKIKDKSNIFPPYNKIFNFTKYCNMEDVKVLIIGQDPYHSDFINPEDKINYPQATGLAFSVPKDCPIPPSLVNIYENMNRFTHQIFKPMHGNLEYWTYQGVLLMNTSLTVEKSKPNSHQYIWSTFIDELIKVITIEHPGLIIVLWGGNAISKMNIIHNKDKHHFIISSHPSPLGFKQKIKSYDSFYETDHFGKINNILKSKNKQEIDWQIY